jgi:ubiquinone/menaquinone biosynthesis C-methylase UbiE
MTSAKQEIVGVFSRAAPSYDVVGPRQFSYFAGRLVEFVDPESGSELLDVATGTGATLLAVAERLADSGRLVGVDLSPEMLERAAVRVRERSLVNVSLHLMDAEALEFADESFDCVLSSFGLSSLPDQPGALQEFRRVLRPSGRIGLLDAFGWYFQHDRRWAWQEEVLRSFGVLREYHCPNAEAELARRLGRPGSARSKPRPMRVPWSFQAMSSGGVGSGHTGRGVYLRRSREHAETSSSTRCWAASRAAGKMTV